MKTAWIHLLLSFLSMTAVVYFYCQSNLLKPLGILHNTRLRMAAFGIGISVWLFLVVTRWILGKKGNHLKGVMARCVFKVLAFTISALLFMVLFKTGAKADFNGRLSKSIRNIKRSLSHDSIPTFIRDEILTQLDWQYTNIDNLMLIDSDALKACMFLCITFFFISGTFDDESTFMNWIFDLFCDIAVHMSAHVFGKHLGRAIAIYVLVVILIISKECLHALKKKKQKQPVGRAPQVFQEIQVHPSSSDQPPQQENQIERKAAYADKEEVEHKGDNASGSGLRRRSHSALPLAKLPRRLERNLSVPAPGRRQIED